MKFANLKIGARLAISFGAILFLVVVMTVLAAYNLSGSSPVTA